MRATRSQIQRFGLALWATALLGSACAPSLRTQGREAMANGNHVEAVRVLRVATTADPKDAAARNDLGLACFRAGNDTCAIEQLRRADLLGGIDGEGLFALGQAYERAGEPDSALAVYSRYAQLGRLSPHRREMVRRVRALVRAAVAREDRVGAETPNNTLAVFRLATTHTSEELKPIGCGLTEWIMTDLQYVRAIRVLERIRMDAVLQELELGRSEVVDPRTAPHLGRLLGARNLVTGNVLGLDSERLRVDLFVTQTGSGAGEISVSAEGPVRQFFTIEKELVFELLAEMGIPLSPLERTQISRIPTHSLASFLAYSHGVEQEWAGNDEEADQWFRQAGAIDPGFDQWGAPPPGDGNDRREETVDDRLTPPEAELSIPGPPELPPPGTPLPEPPSLPGVQQGGVQ